MKKKSSKFKFFLINLMVVIVLVVGIVVYVLYWLEDYTRHNQFILVPSLYNMTLEEAEAVTRHAGLRMQVVDSVYDDKAEPGAVVEQYPVENSQVKENRLIFLTTNAHSPEKIAFPNLRNAAYRQTLQTLETHGFKIGRIEYMPSEFKNLVIQLKHGETELQAGDLLGKGTVVDIVLGDGLESNRVKVPYLVGKNLREAINMLRQSYLNIGDILPDESIAKGTNRMMATVYQQIPEMGEMVGGGSSVSLSITFRKEKIVALDSLMVTE